MKERPILFSAPMVRAILDGRKTQTRRIVTNPIPVGTDEVFAWFGGELRNAPNGCAPDGLWARGSFGLRHIAPSRYGVPGDRLWVKETWARSINNILYAADGVASEGPQGNTDDWDWDRRVPNRWKSPIHMPRKLSRITLVIESVRVERLQDISEEDAIAEGVLGHGGDKSRALTEFMMLWNKINGAGSWAANPWVWVIAFKRIET